MANGISIQQVYDELKLIEKKMVTKEEVEALVDTIDVFSNPETMRQIAESMDDIKRGKVKEVNSVKDLMDEL